jgi:hypothetical protein
MVPGVRNFTSAFSWLPAGPVLALSLLAALSAPAAAVPPPSGAVTVAASISRAGWPLFFEPGPARANRNSSIPFRARGPNFQLLVNPTELEFVLREPVAAPARDSIRRSEAVVAGVASARAVRLTFLAANPEAGISGTGELEAKVNYLLGNDAARWRTQVPTFSGVKVQGLYPGIDVVYYGNQGQFEYDFTVAPHANPSSISFRLDGPDSLEINPEGELVVGLGQARLRQHRPLIYQVVDGVRREISGGYRLRDARTVFFDVGAYDPERPLVIDPVFSYSTFFGGNGGDTGLSVKVDATGSVYLAGETLSTQFPPAEPGNPFQSVFRGGTITGDAFVAKLNNTGSKLLYFTYLGGSTDDGAYDLALDAAGNAYLAGFTVSPDFPTKNALFTQINGIADPTLNVYPVEGFVAELNTNGSALVFSTYLGGSSNDVASAICVDAAGFVYVTGYTYSSDFPVLNPWQPLLAGLSDVFITKIAPGGTNLVYSTFLGGSNNDQGEGIAVDAAGFAYVAGSTSSVNFPISPDATQTNLNGSGVAISVFDAFLARFSPNGRTVVFSTYFGGNQNDFGYRVAVDTEGNAYLVGGTQSSDFLRTNSVRLPIGEDGTNAINFDAFLARFSPLGRPEYSVQFGGLYNDIAWDVAVDATGRAYVVGITLSPDFPVINPFGLLQSTNSGGKDIFVIAFTPHAFGALYSGYLGGGSDDFGYGIALDAEGNAYLSGMTYSSGFPTTLGAFARSLSGPNDSFVVKIRLADPPLAIEQNGDTFLLSWPATAPDYALQSTEDLSPPQTWRLVTATPILTNAEYRVTVTTTNTATLFRLARP